LKPLYRAEWLILSCIAVTALLYFLLEVPFRGSLKLYGQRLSHGLLLYGVGVSVAVLLLRLSDLKVQIYERREIPWSKTVDRYKADFLNPSNMFRDVRMLNVICLTFVVFIHLKNLIPYINGSHYDEMFFSSERVLLGGKLAFEWMDSLIPWTMTYFLSDAYMFFYPYMAILIFIFILQRRADLQHEFVTAFVLLWMVGIFIVYLVPTWGPCFYQSSIYEALPDTEMREIQWSLWKQKTYI